LGHSEELRYLEAAVKLAEELVVQAPPELRRILEHSASQARARRRSNTWPLANSCTHVGRRISDDKVAAAQPRLSVIHWENWSTSCSMSSRQLGSNNALHRMRSRCALSFVSFAALTPRRWRGRQAAGSLRRRTIRRIGWRPTMIRGMHAMFYSSEADALRAFLKDKLGLVGTDVGGGWLIFDAPEADLGVHPTEGGEVPSGTADIQRPFARWPAACALRLPAAAHLKIRLVVETTHDT
jgi:hypothetical protein